MDETNRTQISEILHHRSQAITDAWYGAVVRTSFVSQSGTEIWNHLQLLTNRIVDTLVSEPFNNQAGTAIGSDLTHLHFLKPEALCGTLNILGHELVIALNPEQVAALHPRLVKLTSSLAAGFFRHAQETLLAEQEKIRSALFAERVRIESALRESEERLRMVVSNLPIMLFAVDRAGIFTLVAGKGLEVISTLPTSLEGRSILTTMRDYPQILNNIYRAIAGETFTDQVSVGDHIFDTRYAPWRDQAGYIQGVMGVGIDITERARIEADLHETQRRLADWTHTEQRQAIKDLHAMFVPRLLGPSYALREIEAHLGQLSTDDQTLTNAQMIVAQLHQIIHDLCPANMGTLSIVTAIEQYAAYLSDSNGAASSTIHLAMDPSCADVPHDVALALCRTVQVGLKVASQHPRVREVRLTLTRNAEAIVLHIDADSVVEQLQMFVQRPPQDPHILRALEKVSQLGGEIGVVITPETSTNMTVRVPLNVLTTMPDPPHSRVAGT